jgi:hypothetical protein
VLEAKLNVPLAWSCFLIRILVTGYQALPNVKSLSVLKLFVFSHIPFPSFTRQSYPDVLSNIEVPLKLM